MAFTDTITLLIFIAIIMALLVWVIWFIKKISKPEPKVKWGQLDFLEGIYRRLGWIIFWLVLIALGLGNLSN